jgi:type VI secretion system protein ImpK
MRSNIGGPHTTHILLNLCDELFALILGMQKAQNFGDDESLYKRITGLLTSMEEKARSLKIDSEDIYDVKLALSTFIDEIIWDSDWGSRRSWAARLQRLLLSATTGGNVFFERLDKEIRGKSSKTEVLEVYYMCLMLGFKGKFVGDQKGLQEYIEILRKEVQPEEVKKLSPQGGRQDTSIIRRSIPWWGKIVTWALCIVLPVLLFIILKIFMGQAVEELIPAPMR